MLSDLKACAAPRCSQLCRWLGTQAEELGVDIYPGFAASELLLKGGAAAGVATNDFGVAKDGTRKPTFQRGLELQARATLLAEGCRGSLSEVGPCMLVQTLQNVVQVLSQEAYRGRRHACLLHLTHQGAGVPSGSSSEVGHACSLHVKHTAADTQGRA